MKKRISFLIVGLLFLAGGVSAQFAFGLKAGLSTEAFAGHDLKVSGEGFNDLTAKASAADYGIQAGLFLRIPLGERLFLQPEGTFNTNTAVFSFDGSDGGQVVDEVIEARYNHLDVPLLLGYQLGILRFQGGPVGHFYFNEGSGIFTSNGWESAMESFNIGYALGGSLDIGKITLDLRYDGNFSRFGQTFTIGGQEFAVDEAARRWIATIGYRF